MPTQDQDQPYLQRYLAGEHVQVWADLLALGPAIRNEPLYSDGLAVARETMRRVRHNIETLIPRLTSLGYRFGYEALPGIEPEHQPAIFAPPPPDVQEIVSRGEHRVGVLPLSLRAFFEIVGEVNFIGAVPDTWHDWLNVGDSLDALYVYPAKMALEDADAWSDMYDDFYEDESDLPGPSEEDLCDSRAYHALPRDCFIVAIAPDSWHKYDISGCGGYEIAVPNPAADARLLTEWHRTTFVNYLRICFRWGGFPGFERAPNPPTADLAYLTKDLLPI